MSSLSISWRPPAQEARSPPPPCRRPPGLVPSSPSRPLPQPFLLPQPGLPPAAALPRHIPLPQTFISRARNFSAGFDLPLRHFLEWPLGVCPHPDGIQMQTWLLSPALAPQLGKINPDPHLTPTPYHWLCFLGLRSELRLTPRPASFLKARASSCLIICLSPQPLFSPTGNCSGSQSKCQHDSEGRALRCSSGPGREGRAGCVMCSGSRYRIPWTSSRDPQNCQIQMRKPRCREGHR